ncbi:MAG: CHAT domain-containing protein [Pseudomonadota bacterium]
MSRISPMSPRAIKTAISMGGTQRRLAQLSLSASALVLVACAGQGGPSTASGGAICAQIERQANEAFRQNFLTEYEDAQRAWTDILRLYDTEAEAIAGCEQVPPRSIVLANLGLVYSNQRNFTAADGMLDASAAEAGATFENRTKIYRALHDLNRSAVGDETLSRAEEVSVGLNDPTGPRLLESELSGSVLQLSPAAQRQLIEEGVNLSGLAFAYLSRGENTRSLIAIDEALARVSPVDGVAASYVPRFQVTRAEALLALGRSGEALAQIDAAIAGYGEDMKRSALMGRAEAIRGAILSDLGRDAAALEAYETGFGILQRTPVRVSYDLLHPYIATVQRVIAAEPARRAALEAQLFRDAQVVRSEVTASSISLAAAARAEGTGALAEAIRSYNRAVEDLSIIVAQKLLVEGRAGLATPALLDEVESRFEEAEAREEEAIARINELDPDYFDRLVGEADLAEVQRVLAPNEAYVQVVMGDPESLVFVIRSDSVTVQTVDGLSVEDTRSIVSGLREIVRFQLIYAPNESHRLYEAYFEPVEAALDGADTLIFSLSDALTALPMEVLATRRSGISDLARLDDFTDVAWLADSYEVSYVPAPRNLVDLRDAGPRSTEPRPIIAFGDFQPGADVPTILETSFLPDECAPIAEAISQLPPLEGTKIELETIRETFGAARTQVVAAEAFTEVRIAEASAAGSLADFGVLHFATHGILPTGDCVRRPALSVSAQGVAGSDGLLTDIEIRRLDLNADLVVLSACDTAGALDENFNAAGGEALSGLARAFFDAGTSAVVASHWPVGDAVTAQIVADFYDRLTAGATMSEALRAAQASLRSNRGTSDPLFWGAFVVIGDAERTLGATG